MKILLRKSYLLFLLLACGNLLPASAQDFSYVYIQGDKKTPIYVKAEGVMMPRYGKHYALISRLAPGPLSLDILFQQNEYPAMHFTILVPENGKRAFMISKKEGALALYDLEQHFYLKPGNDVADDHLPTVISNGSLSNRETPAPETAPEVPVRKQPQTAAKTVQQPKHILPKQTIAIKAAAKKEAAAKAAAEQAGTTPAAGHTAPQFIDNITFNNDNNTQAVPATPGNTGDQTPIINSDCSATLSDQAFSRLLIDMDRKETEDEKLGIFLETLSQRCLSTDMTAAVVRKLSTDAARFSALKRAYPKTTDQARFPELESLLEDAEWKDYFRDMVHH